MVGPSATEAGYSSSYSYLVALSNSDGKEGSAVAMPGYGLYDRALGATYLNGLWEAIEKSHKQK